MSQIAVTNARAFRLEEYTERHQNTLRGFATIVMPSGMKVHDVLIHTSHGRAWASPPSKPMIGRDGAVMKDEDGRVRYAPIIAFATKELRDRWSDAVVEAVLAAHPKALGE